MFANSTVNKSKNTYSIILSFEKNCIVIASISNNCTERIMVF